MTKTSYPPLTWKPLYHPRLSFEEMSIVEARIGDVLRSWANTPYREGDQVRGTKGGVDCFRFLAAVYDELEGRRRTLPRNLPSDRSMHDPEGAKAAMRTLIRLYEPLIEIHNGVIEPGDGVVTAPRGGGPGHALVVGSDPHQLWHVEQNVGVCRTGLSLTDMDIDTVLRPKDKHLWLPK